MPTMRRVSTWWEDKETGDMYLIDDSTGELIDMIEYREPQEERVQEIDEVPDYLPFY